MSSFTCTEMNNLEEIVLVAGSEMTLEFQITDSAGSPVDLTTCTLSWEMSPYGFFETAVTKSGSVSGSASNVFDVVLASADTTDLYGKYIHQPKIVDFNGSEFRPAQGIITIIPAIK